MKYEDSRTSYRNPVSQSLLINELSQEREREREGGDVSCATFVDFRLFHRVRNNRGLFRAVTLSRGEKMKKRKATAHGSTTPELRRNEKPYFYIRRNELLYAPD